VTNAGTLALSATGANVIALSTNGSEAARIDSSGNVGIGTSAPVQKLELNEDTTSGGPYLQFENRGTGTADNTNTYNVGGIIAAGYRDASNPSNIASIMFERAPFSGGASSTGSIVFGAMANGTTGIPTERMRINSSGNVGIGTSSPTVNFEVRDSTNGANLLVGGSGTLNIMRVWGGAADALSIGTNGTEGIYLDTSANVGIGTSSPGGKLGIATGGTTNVVAALGGTFPAFTYRNGTATWFHAGKHPSSDYFYIGHGATPTTNVDVVVDGSGNVGIGTTSDQKVSQACCHKTL
jgi:trimeric autotransporter adhesin